MRQNSIAILGWTRVDVTWDDLVKRPDEVIGWITAALRAATAKSETSAYVVRHLHEGSQWIARVSPCRGG